jgi:ubiquinone/menaquinone biosynthesis C-methylase UbiE
MGQNTLVREHLHGLWAAVAQPWERNADFVDARHAVVTDRMLAVTRPGPGDRVLELASAGAGVGLAAAGLVAPDGEVVLSDVVPEMAAVAERRAQARGVRGVRTRVLDLDQIDEPDATFDVVVCRDGLQFAIDPLRAASEIHRILRPHGRAALAVWAGRDLNPWLGVVFDVVSAELGRPVPPPHVPTPFSLGDPDHLVDVLGDGGFDTVAVEALSVPLRAPSFDAWWNLTTSLAGPLTTILAALSDDVTAALKSRARRAVRSYVTPSGLEFPGVALIASTPVS